MKSTQLSDTERERLDEAFGQVPFARLLGLEMGAIERGTATFYLPVSNNLKQNKGLVHGGAIAALIDTAAAFAAVTLLEPEQSTTTIDLTVHYLRPLTDGRAEARARVLRAGRRLLVISVEVFDETENLVATAVTTYLRIMPE